MPLIACPDCRSQVSTNAVACPRCGSPIASRSLDAPIQGIERTSKSLKAQGCVGGVVMLLGMAILVAAAASPRPGGAPVPMLIGIVLSAGGMLVLIIAKVRAWWHHG